MRKKVSIGFGTGVILLIIAGGEGMNIMLNFILAGVIPGTHYAAPFWLMMALYCTIIALVVTDSVEQWLKFIYGHREAVAQSKGRMPHRRYSQL
jgi:hypothetical protein